MNLKKKDTSMANSFYSETEMVCSIENNKRLIRTLKLMVSSTKQVDDLSLHDMSVNSKQHDLTEVKQ